MAMHPKQGQRDKETSGCVPVRKSGWEVTRLTSTRVPIEAAPLLRTVEACTHTEVEGIQGELRSRKSGL